MLKKFFKYILILLIIGCIYIPIWIKTSDISLDSLDNPPQEGDLVFQTTTVHGSFAVMAASYSPYSHVGILKKDKTTAQFMVVEGAGPVREIPFSEWLNHGLARRVTIKRMRDLKPEEATRLLNAAQKYYGRPYDILFQFDKEKIYCSELVYYAFREGPHIDIGHEQQIRDLHVDNFAVRGLIKERWQVHPVCKEQGANSYEACYKVIMDQKLITPQSIADDSRLDLVYSNYGWFAR